MKSVILCSLILGLIGCQKSRLENVLGEQERVVPVAPTVEPSVSQFTLPPTADVEVIDPTTLNPVTLVVMGNEYIIRPTQYTVDSDGANTANCKNFGIAALQYSVEPASDGSSANKQRIGCQEGFEDFRYVFTTPGQATISMLASTDEPGETSKARRGRQL